MGEIRRMEPEGTVVTTGSGKKRVAAYVRVSRNTERLVHSFSAQIDHYRKRIADNPGWEYAGIYADRGISGTKIRKREGLQQLLADCESGRIDIILTKSISRFARNTVDLLRVVRYLKELGTEVYFEKEGISSMSGEGELMLSILGSFAQEEIRSISENIQWGIRKAYGQGREGVRNSHVFGYQYDGSGYVVVPEEAMLVRQIFDEYIAGIPLRSIAGHCNISYSRIRYMVRNEIYCGDRRFQKVFVEDPVQQKKVRNEGQLPQYYLRNCHEAIIDRSVFLMAQQEAERRAGQHGCCSCFTGRLLCGICGDRYTRKKCVTADKCYVYWICHSKKEAGKTCKSVNLKEDILIRISSEMLADRDMAGKEADKWKTTVPSANMQEIDKEEFKKRVRQIIVSGDGSLEFYFYGGRRRDWKNG